MTQKKIIVVHGPNLDLLGEREPELYGSETLDEINGQIRQKAEALGLDVSFFQSNHEGEIIDTIHQAMKSSDGLMINPAGLTHTSVALRDAVSAYEHPVVEVHLSNIYSREEFRRHSYISPVATAVICGLGVQGYLFGVEALSASLKSS